jgi:uncharacterized membrane protein YjdF
MKKEILIGYMLLLIFTFFGIFNWNLEFLIYSVAILVLLLLITFADKYINFSSLALYFFDAWMVLHIIGGYTSIAGIRTYDYVIFNIVGDPFNILKFDQFIHLFCYIGMGLLMHDVVIRYAPKAHKFAVSLIAILAACGIGALNEFIEFFAVVILDTQGVGGYYNTALDIVFNTIGASISSLIFWWNIKRKKK